MMKNIFKENDRVFHISYGWGDVISEGDVTAGVKFDNDEKPILIFEVGLLSFTEYKLDGISQERSEKLPERGQVVWVRDEEDDHWTVGHFVKKDGLYYEVSEGSPHIEYYFTTWKYLTTKNPYLNEN
jgi:hypothetical protein